MNEPQTLYFTNFTRECYYALKLPEREVEILFYFEEGDKSVQWMIASQKFVYFLFQHMQPLKAATYNCIRRQLHHIAAKTPRRNIDYIYQYATT